MRSRCRWISATWSAPSSLIGLFVVAVALQVAVRPFRPFLYWLTIIATTTVGTTLADFADRSLGIGYAGGTAILFALLMAALGTWYRTAGSVSVDTVEFPEDRDVLLGRDPVLANPGNGARRLDGRHRTGLRGRRAGLRRRAGGRRGGVLLLERLTHALFWSAFILTRPLGATVGDFLDKPVAHGGLAISRFSVSALLALFMIACIFIFRQRAGRHPGTSTS